MTGSMNFDFLSDDGSAASTMAVVFGTFTGTKSISSPTGYLITSIRMLYTTESTGGTLGSGNLVAYDKCSI